MTLFWQRMSVVTGAALILWGISERIFWSLVQPDEHLPIILLGILPYWIATHLMFTVMAYFRVQRFSEILLAGAFYGWFVEALYAMTFFGGAGIPLPYSISWTSLSWHMLISVGVVWWLHRMAMQQSFCRSLAYSAGLGVFWALWSMLWFFEAPPIINTIGMFAAHAFGVTLLMVIGHWLMSCGPQEWEVSRNELIGVVALPVLFFIFVTIPAVAFMAVAIPLLGLILYIPARRIKVSRAATSVFAILTTPVPWRNILTLCIAPLIATLAYAFMLDHSESLFQFNRGVLFVTTPLGFVVFGWAWWKGYTATSATV